MRPEHSFNGAALDAAQMCFESLSEGVSRKVAVHPSSRQLET